MKHNGKHIPTQAYMYINGYTYTCITMGARGQTVVDRQT